MEIRGLYKMNFGRGALFGKRGDGSEDQAMLLLNMLVRSHIIE